MYIINIINTCQWPFFFKYSNFRPILNLNLVDMINITDNLCYYTSQVRRNEPAQVFWLLSIPKDPKFLVIGELISCVSGLIGTSCYPSPNWQNVSFDALGIRHQYWVLQLINSCVVGISWQFSPFYSTNLRLIKQKYKADIMIYRRCDYYGKVNNVNYTGTRIADMHSGGSIHQSNRIYRINRTSRWHVYLTSNNKDSNNF